MAETENVFIPPDPQNKALRPLNKGMYRDLPANVLEDGAVFTAKNLLVKKASLRKRPGLTPWAGGNQTSSDDQPILAIAPFWKVDGNQNAVYLTSRFLYQSTAYSAPSVKYLEYVAEGSTCSVTGAVVTGTGGSSGYQDWRFDVVKVSGDDSGLEDDSTTYTASISVDGTPNAISIAGEDAQTMAEVVTELNADLSGATASFEDIGNGRIRITSDSTGASSIIAITDTDLFATLEDAHSTYEVAVDGLADPGWNTASSRIYSQATGIRGHGDFFVLDADGSGDGPEIIEIASIASDTSLTLASTPTGTYGAGTDWKIYKRFHVYDDTLLDWTVADNKLIITDYVRPLYAYDGTSITEHIPGTDYVCGCLCHMSSRLWIANIKEEGDIYRQRIRWSSATDRTNFESYDYLDIPYTSGKISRLLPLGDQLVAYFDDAVYLGRPTNYTDLPKSFNQVETAGIGLLGPRAVCSFFNGHAFVGQDDIYYIDANGNVQAFGSPVVSETIDKCTRPSRIYAAFDPDNERLAFGFPETGQQITKVWSYNYKTKAWSYDEVECTSLSNPLLDLDLTYADLTDAGVLDANTYTGWGATFATYGLTQNDVSLRDLFVSNNGYTYIYSESAGDDDGTPMEVILETGDLDFGNPDLDKEATKLSLRFGQRPSVDVLWNVRGSVDGGNTWTDFGNMTIADDQLETKIDFQITGATIRFRLTTTSAASPFDIADVVVRIQQRGIQYELA